MLLRILPALALSTALAGCAHDNADSRLDGDPGIDSRELAAMLKLDCSQRREEVQLARDESQSDFDRLANYRLAVKAFNGAADRIEGAFTRTPDLLYLAEGDALRLRLQRCQAQAKTFTDELRKFQLVVDFRPASAVDEKAAAAPKAAPAPLPEPLSKRVKAKTVKVARHKKIGRPTAVLANR